jgi:peptide/nickel transport system permease protein
MSEVAVGQAEATTLPAQVARRPLTPNGRRPLLNAPLIGGSAIVVALIVGSFVVPALSGWSPTRTNPAATLAAPSVRHLFGTDDSGFDVFTRVFYAPRNDFPLVAGSVAIAFIAGSLLGLIAGFSRGSVGTVVARLADVAQAFPTLVLALAIVAFAGDNAIVIVWVLGLVQTPIFLRLVRQRTLVVREMRYVEAAVALGNSKQRLLVRHVLPNAIAPAIVQLGISMSYCLLAIAGLAFLGVGVQPPTPEWGSMILTSRSDITTGQWWTVVFPGAFIAVSVIGFNLISEGIERARQLAA